MGQWPAVREQREMESAETLLRGPWPCSLPSPSRARLRAPEPLVALVSHGCGWGLQEGQTFQLSGLPVPPGTRAASTPEAGQVPAEKPIPRGTLFFLSHGSQHQRGGQLQVVASLDVVECLPLHRDRSSHPRPHAPEKQGHERQAQERSRSSTRGRHLDVTRGPAAGSGVTSHRPVQGAPRQRRADRGAQSCARPGGAG